MKKIITVILTITLLCTPLSVIAGNGDTIVHITKTGEKYHSAGCSYLKSDIPTTLADAVSRGYTPCSRCNPPTLIADDPVPEFEPQEDITKEDIDAIIAEVNAENQPAPPAETTPSNDTPPKQESEKAPATYTGTKRAEVLPVYDSEKQTETEGNVIIKETYPTSPDCEETVDTIVTATLDFLAKLKSIPNKEN